MNPVMGSRQWSNGRLVLLFLLSLLLFIAWRWQPGAWVRDRIDAVARQAGVGLQYHAISVHGLSLRMDGVSLAIPGMATPIPIERLSVRPDWLHLLSGRPGGDVSLLWHGQSLHFSAILRGHRVALHLPDASMAVSALEPLWQKTLVLPLRLAGDIHLHGDAVLALPDGHPVSGDIELAWRDARASMSGMAYPLGSYRLQGSGKKGVWSLSATGGDELPLAAHGRLDTSNADFRAWTVHAQGQVSARQGTPLSGMMGDKPLQFALSGPLTSAHWRFSASR